MVLVDFAEVDEEGLDPLGENGDFRDGEETGEIWAVGECGEGRGD